MLDSMKDAAPDTNGLVLYDGQPNHLTLEQKRMLVALLECNSVSEATRVTGISRSRHERWLRTDPNYQEGVRKLGDGLLAEARARLDSLLPKAAETFEDALDKNKVTEVLTHCPKCGHGFMVGVEVTDLKTRLSVAKDLFKRSGDLAAKLQVSGEVKHRDMSLEDRIALAQIEAGQNVPPDVVASLRQRGLIPTVGPGRTDTPPESGQSTGRSQDPDTLEGEYREAPAD